CERFVPVQRLPVLSPLRLLPIARQGTRTTHSTVSWHSRNSDLSCCQSTTTTRPPLTSQKRHHSKSVVRPIGPADWLNGAHLPCDVEGEKGPLPRSFPLLCVICAGSVHVPIY